ncbi:hypothetical protein DACRYDRAFT_109519 [Dacryopinax primogenitus]|uniref:Uncharacterized protein n=1 Tax=Dacryopinax primogenitus (strain DJM 731) TaxID=1858805 RepID=M5G2L8_DACPD|nr:uncharacterized protein DACRYDRAFT_109519 [Dacryopinax primogenitus]EJU00097.1 hypothetical protein DACRYDRAFT_109519 [Dacryopinax primogenitus]
MALWQSLNQVLWNPARDVTALTQPLLDDFTPFQAYAHLTELSTEEFYPPTCTCLNLHCPHFVHTSEAAALYDPQ